MLLRFAFPLVFAAAAIGGSFLQHSAVAAAPDAAAKVSEPLQHENLAIYLVRGQSAPGAVPVTLEEALVKGTIIVHETGTVSELKIENTGKEPVFVQFGDLVKGGKQDRVLTSSLLIPPMSGKIAIGAYCVEQGRWAMRGKEDVSRFSSSSAQIFSREAKVAIARAPLDAAAARAQPLADNNARPTLRPDAPRTPPEQRLVHRGPGARQEVDRGPASGQGEVWRSVAAVQARLGEKLAAPVASAESRTSLQLTLENERLKSAQQGFIAALEPKALEGDDVIGVVIAVNGKIASGDVYPSNGLFRKMWPKLVRAAAAEAVASRQDAAPAAPVAAEAEKFLAEAQDGTVSERGEVIPTPSPGPSRARARVGAAVNRAITPAAPYSIPEAISKCPVRPLRRVPRPPCA
jgi:hypothetical protein